MLQVLEFKKYQFIYLLYYLDFTTWYLYKFDNRPNIDALETWDKVLLIYVEGWIVSLFFKKFFISV